MSQYRPLAAVVLAAGEGTRMRSGTPKVLHPLCGRPMLLHVVDALAELPLERIVDRRRPRRRAGRRRRSRSSSSPKCRSSSWSSACSAAPATR